MSSVTCFQNNQFALNHDAWRITNMLQMLQFWACSSLWSGPTRVEVTHVILKSTVSQFMDGKALFIITRVLDDLMIQGWKFYLSKCQGVRVLILVDLTECQTTEAFHCDPLGFVTPCTIRSWGWGYIASRILLLQQFQNCENRCLTESNLYRHDKIAYYIFGIYRSLKYF